MIASEKEVQFPGWKTVRKIGAGSYGAVYEIEREIPGGKESAALKVLSIPQNESEIEDLFNSGYDKTSVVKHFNAVLSNVVRDYQLMAEMKDHANIVCCNDIRYIQRDDGIGWNIYIRMEQLTPLVKTTKEPFAEQEVITLGKDISKALILCRDKNIIHRDIKPQNIFVTENGVYKLGDFGTARTVEYNSGGMRIGTYNYMAPEVFNNEEYDFTADIYSLGLVMYWLMNERRLPFQPMPPSVPTPVEMDTAMRRRLNGESLPDPVRGSRGLKQIVLKACSFHPKDRYHTAEELLAELDALKSDMFSEDNAEANPVTLPASGIIGTIARKLGIKPHSQEK